MNIQDAPKIKPSSPISPFPAYLRNMSELLKIMKNVPNQFKDDLFWLKIFLTRVVQEEATLKFQMAM